jgi:PKD repeat protein
LRAFHVTFFIDHTPPPIAADFSAMPTSGTAPLDVTFTDLSDGAVESWAWDFDGDGLTDSTAENPTFTYHAAGTYTVTLTVAGGGEQDTETKADYITVDPPGTSPDITIQSVVANDVPAGANYDITATLTNDGGEGTVTLKCTVTGAKTQVLSQKTVTVPASGETTVAWSDAVSRKMRAGDYTATVVILDTPIEASDTFAIE